MADDINVNEPAFPRDHRNDGHNGLTARQYAAIKLRVPNSGMGWLDDMILQSLRQDLEAKLLSALLSNPARYEYIAQLVGRGATQEDATNKNINKARRMADAMLAELEEQWMTTSANC